MSTAAWEGDIPFGDAPRRWAEVARRADRDERLHLVREGGAPALVVMTADAFERAVEDAADLAVCREVLAQLPAHDPAQADARHASFMAFLETVASD